jgi:MSHA biogenesis protein MshO
MRRISLHGFRTAMRGARGITLVELILVIVISGVIAAAIAVFIPKPVQGYVDAARRAEMTDIADTALRRMTRDLRSALPNSIRTTTSGNVRYVEYLQTSGGGRYRAEPDSGGAGDVLDFTAADTTFDVLGTMPTLAAGDSIVVYNLTADPSLATANAYQGDNRTTYSSNTATTVTIASKQFPFPSPGKRFQVMQYPVTYACDPLPLGTGQLRRYWGYTPQLTPQPTPPAGGSSALLATNVTDCSFSYSTAGASGRTGVVALILQITESGEAVRLFQQTHVSNVP